KPSAPACRLTGMPMAAGTEWVYGPADSPNKPSGQLPPKPKQATRVPIKVVSVKPSATPKQTEITLEETTGDRTITTTLTCTKDAVVVPPESFFFAGEPGGGLQVTLDNIERTGSSYAFKAGKLAVPEWIENIK